MDTAASILDMEAPTLGLSSKWIEGPGFAVSNTHGALYYREDGKQYTLTPVEGGCCSIFIERMGDEDAALGKMAQDDRIRIARNIRTLLQSKGIIVDIFLDHRPMT